eukprot:2945_1
MAAGYMVMGMLISTICLFCVDSGSSQTESTNVPTSCVGLEDGYHYVKLLEGDSYPIIYVLCSNEYMMIDYSLDNDWSSYFTTFVKWHYAVVGPTKNEHQNWRQWFLPGTDDDSADESGHFLVSPQCDSCDLSQDNQLHADQSAYYMSSLSFGCFARTKGVPACDMDYRTYQCRMCEWDHDNIHLTNTDRPDTMSHEEMLDEGIQFGSCSFEIRSSSQPISQTFSECVVAPKGVTNWKPSLGLDGRFCECFKPNMNGDVAPQLTVTQQQLQEKKDVLQLQTKTEQTTEENTRKTIELYASDFEDGTYRITSPGNYIVMEDIVFDFNAPPKGHSSPNNIKDNYYWPVDPDRFPGAMEARGPYVLGFFAGITVECSDVVLDLNGFELRMSRMFYYQQPWFSAIELASQTFLPQQGPGFFGADPQFASNVVIKNGVIGLASHAGIHGNYNTGVVIDGIHVKQFLTHGMQFNGFNDFEIKNVEIGPSTDIAYLNGNYAHMRLLLPTLASIAQQHATDYLTFTGRDEGVTMQQLVDKVIVQMDMILDFVLNGVTYEEHEDWGEAKEMFINPSGLPYGAALYGLFLNYPGAGIFGWQVNDLRSGEVKLQNVNIHDLRHKGVEVVGFEEDGRFFSNAFNAPLPVKDLFGDAMESFGDGFAIEYPQYIGSIITDIHVAMYYFGRDDFDYWPTQPFEGMDDGLTAWALGKNPNYIALDGSRFTFQCNMDVMFHPGKGLLGIKISGADYVQMSNVNIDNLQDETAAGSDLCGAGNPSIHGIYHFAQQIPYQIGFSMNMAMAMTIDYSDVEMEDIAIQNIYSATGLAYGFAGWFESNTQMTGEMVIGHLNAGYSVRGNGATFDDLPNKAAEACAIRIYDDDHDVFTIQTQAGFKAYQSCIDGQIGCKGYKEYTTFGDVDNDSECDFELPFEFAPNDFNQLLQSRHNELFIVQHPDQIQSQTIVMLFVFAITMTIVLVVSYVKKSNAKQNQKKKQQNATELTHLIQSQY